MCSGGGLFIVYTGTSPFCLLWLRDLFVLMERLYWVRHRCLQLISTDRRRGWYSPPSSLPAKSSLDVQDPLVQRFTGKRRVVVLRCGPHQADYHSFSKGFQDNSIRTTKYNLISFIPLNLFQQFHRSDIELNNIMYCLNDLIACYCGVFVSY